MNTVLVMTAGGCGWLWSSDDWKPPAPETRDIQGTRDSLDLPPQQDLRDLPPKGEGFCAETGAFSEDFERKNYSGWTVAQGLWSADNMYLQMVKAEEVNKIEHPISFERSKGVFLIDMKIPEDTCNSGTVDMFDSSGKVVMTLYLSSCGPEGTDELTLQLGDKFTRSDWNEDMQKHTFKVEFKNGEYTLYKDGVLMGTVKDGPACLRITKMRLYGWSASANSTQYDNIYLGSF